MFLCKNNEIKHSKNRNIRSGKIKFNTNKKVLKNITNI